MFYYMYITYNTTYLQAVSNCSVMVSQRWIGEGVGRVHIVEIPKLGYVLGVAEKFPRYMRTCDPVNGCARAQNEDPH